MTRHSLGIVLVLLIACAALRGEQPKRSKKLWLLSMAAGVADAHSSYGGYEANPLLRSADGRLRSRGVAVKFGLRLPGWSAGSFAAIRSPRRW